MKSHIRTVALSFVIGLSVVCLPGCVYLPKAQVERGAAANKPRFLTLQVNNDIDLVAFEIRQQLEAKEFRVYDTTAEPDSGLVVVKDDGRRLRVYDSATDSAARYVLIVSYRRGGYPYRIRWRARIVDQAERRTLGTYTLDWNAGTALNFGWSNSEIVSDMIEKLVLPVFSGSEEK